MFKSSDITYLKPSGFNYFSLILRIGYSLFFSCLFKFLKSLRKCTCFALRLVCERYGAPHSELFYLLRNPSRTKWSVFFLNNYLCNFVTGYCFYYIGFEFYFNSKSTGCFFRVPSVTSKNASNFCDNFGK